MEIRTFIQNEQTILRNELQELKKCQIQYFLLSVTATGAVFGFNKDLLGGDMIYLTPMLIILPCWLTFFDKANTITRLTGYVIVFIEKQLVESEPTYIGYENALAVFREKEKLSKKKPDRDLNELFKFTRHQYWKINWFTFLALSLTCLGFPVFKYKGFDFLNGWSSWAVYLTFVCAEIICGFYSGWIVRRLILGKYSYKNVTVFWKTVLESLKSEQPCD